MIDAFSFMTSTMARLYETTASGSYPAFKTRVRTWASLRRSPRGVRADGESERGARDQPGRPGRSENTKGTVSRRCLRVRTVLTVDERTRTSGSGALRSQHSADPLVPRITLATLPRARFRQMNCRATTRLRLSAHRGCRSVQGQLAMKMCAATSVGSSIPARPSTSIAM